jgi:hypothetical protein
VRARIRKESRFILLQSIRVRKVPGMRRNNSENIFQIQTMMYRREDIVRLQKMMNQGDYGRRWHQRMVNQEEEIMKMMNQRKEGRWH